MGIIIRQSVKSTIVNFVGVAIAAFSSLLIYPSFKEVYGLAQFLIGMGALFAPIASIGLVSAIIKFFPKFKTDDHNNNGLLILIFISFIVPFTIFGALYLLLKTQIIGFLKSYGLDNNNLLDSYWVIILCLTAFMILSSLCMNYAASNKRIVIPQILTNLALKIFLPVAILSYVYYEWADISFAKAIVIFYISIVIAQLIYLKTLGVLKFSKPNLTFVTRDLKKEVWKYQFFSSYFNIANLLAFRIDNVMIPMLLNLGSNGIYSIMLFMASVIEIPIRSLKAIAGPIIANAWEKDDLNEIETIYKKTSLNLIIPGIATLLFIWFSFDQIASISSDPSVYHDGKYVFLVLGVGKLIDLVTSINDHIIIYSEKYKYNVIFILILAVTNIALNFWLITEYGIIGAAFASAFAYLIYNSIKMIFIYYHYKMHPLSIQLFWILVVGIITTFILFYMPLVKWPLIQILLNAGIIALLYFPTIYILKLSPDFNRLCNIVINRIKVYF